MTIGTRSDATKVILGCPRRGPETVGNFPHDGTAVPPGVAGHLNTSAEFVAGLDGPLIGISRGVSQSADNLNSVTQEGKEVPLKLTNLGVAASGEIAITSVANLLDNVADDIEVAGVVFVAQSSAVEEGDATFRAATSPEATAISLAAQINAHEDASLLVTATVGVGADDHKVLIVANEVGEAGNAITLDYTDNDNDGTSVGATVTGSGTLEDGYEEYDYLVAGAAVYVDDTTGFATENGDGSTISNWKYSDGVVLDGVSQTTGDDVPCALVDM